MNVLLLRDLRSERRASMERYADELERALAALSGYEVRSWAPHEGSPAGAPLRRKFANYRARFLDYPRLVRALPADVYHVVDHAYAHLLRGLPPERTVITCHDVTLLTMREWDGKASRRPAALMLHWSVRQLRRAAHVIAVGETTRRDLLRLNLVPPERTSIVPNGIAPVFLNAPPCPDASTRRRLVRSNEEMVVLHVGTAAPQKNLPVVLACIAELRRRGVAARLVRVGAQLPPRIRRLAHGLGITGFISELGRCSDEELARIYRSADLLLYPSLKEGFGWPPLEAMACGLPVVTSEDAALLDVTGNVALHAPARDVRGLSDACARLLGDAALRECCRQKGIARARTFTWSRTAGQVAAVYERLAVCERPAAVPGS